MINLITSDYKSREIEMNMRIIVFWDEADF